MVLKYIKSQSSVRPDLVDTSSSRKVVYIRQNIVEATRIDEMSGEEYTYYEYDEAKLTKAEYAQYLKDIEVSDVQQQRMDIDEATERIAELEETVELTSADLLNTQLALTEQYEANIVLEEELVSAQEEITYLQLALCEIYETLEV